MSDDDPVVAFDGIGVWRRSEVAVRLAALDQQRAEQQQTEKPAEDVSVPTGHIVQW